MKPIIEIKKLTKSYQSLKAVDDLSFNVYEGEILGLLGPNGSGKTTTINCLLSLLSYQDGMIKILNQEMKPDNYNIKSQIGVVFQDISVFSELTVLENIDYFCGLYINDRKKRKQYIQEVIDLVGLEDFLKFYPKELSEGLLRRLNIACGISHKPRIIILDEPTVAVDPQSRNQILEGIEKLREKGATIIYTTHYMEEVEKICDRVIILDKGKILASGTPDGLKELVKTNEKVNVEILKLDLKHMDNLKKLKNVHEIKYQKNILSITFKKGKNNLANLLEYLKEEKIKYLNIYSSSVTLNDVFLELTGKELRD